VSIKRTYPTPDSGPFNTLIQRSRPAGSIAYVWSHLNAPVELSTRYTTLGTTAEIGSTSATVE